MVCERKIPYTFEDSFSPRVRQGRTESPLSKTTPYFRDFERRPSEISLYHGCRCRHSQMTADNYMFWLTFLGTVGSSSRRNMHFLGIIVIVCNGRSGQRAVEIVQLNYYIGPTLTSQSRKYACQGQSEQNRCPSILKLIMKGVEMGYSLPSALKNSELLDYNSSGLGDR